MIERVYIGFGILGIIIYELWIDGIPIYLSTNVLWKDVSDFEHHPQPRAGWFLRPTTGTVSQDERRNIAILWRLTRMPKKVSH